MNVSNGIDSEDDDVFEILRIKPVVKLTKQQAIEIKNRVLENEEKSSRDEYVKRMSLTRGRKRKLTERKDENSVSNTATVGELTTDKKVTPVKVNSSPSPSKSSASKQITDYFSPVKTPDKSGGGPGVNNAELASKQVKVNLNSLSNFQSPSLKCEGAGGSKTDSDVIDELNLSDFDGLSSISTEKTTKREYSYFYSQSLKRIIHQVLKDQLLLEDQTVKKGKIFSKLFMREEYDYFEKFFKLDEKACSLFARMLCRKKSWHRVSRIYYADISENIEDVFMVLVKNKFVDNDIILEKLEDQLELLSGNEIKVLSKKFNVKVGDGCKRKEKYIDAFVKSSREQRSVLDMWKKNSESGNVNLLKNEIKSMLGTCIRLNKMVLDTFNKLLLLFSLAHDVNEEDRWGSQIRMMTEIYNSTIHFPNYVVKPTVIFELQDDFSSYKKATCLMAELDVALVKRNYKDFFRIGQKAKKKFQKAIENQGFKERFQELPSFLKRYNAGSVYARILTIYCDKFRKKKNPEEVAQILNMLLNQDVFLLSKRGHWCNVLAQTYEEIGRTVEAANIILNALKDCNINEIDRLVLQQRGRAIYNKKQKGITDNALRFELDAACTISISEPSCVEISAKALPLNNPGCKTVYVQESTEGKVYSSVEQQAINYYKRNGFTEGIHAEGALIQTMYFLVFFDIIYGLSPPGVFQSPYQERPLDLFSQSFYLNRKDAIDTRLREMLKWSILDFEERFSNVCKNHFGVSCVVNWKDNFDIKMYCDIIKCLGVPEFTRICNRLVLNLKIYGSGFPDLTLWNPETRRCKFVEVKGLNDKLSPKQRIWLHFLKSLNIDCEVCNVRSKFRTVFSN